MNWSALRRTHWGEYAVRFALGGAVTVVTGLLAHGFGPVVGGLFLAFPAIFPASATLIEKHETNKKRQAGLDGVARGRKAAALDAAGSVLGAAALIVFAFVAWKALPNHAAPIALGAAALLWFVVATCLWWLRKRRFFARRPA